MNWFWKKENRDNSHPHKDIPTDACTEVQTGLGLLQKILNTKEYGAMHQSPFFAAVNLISSSIGQMHWEVKSKVDEDIPDNFYVDNLFKDALLTQFTMTKNMIKDVLLHGNGFAYINRDQKGMPVSLTYLPFGDVTIMYNPINRTLFYQVPRLGKSLVEPINIIHINMHSEDGIHGKSILTFAGNTIKLSGNAEKAATDFFASGMSVNGVLSTDVPRLTKDQRQVIAEAWLNSQVGRGSGIAVLENGMKYQPVSSNSKDGQLLETRVFNIQEVARWFNISPVLLGDLTKTSYNNLEQAQLQLVTNTLAPFVQCLEQELNRKLILPKDQAKYYIDIVEEDIIKQDKQSQVNYLSTLVNTGIISRNEARKQLGFGPVDGGDELTVSYTDINQNKVNQNEDKNTEENEDE